MFLQYGTTFLNVIDLVRFDRESVWSEDMVDVLSVRQTLGVVASYAPGGFPQLTSAVRLSPATQASLIGADPTGIVLVGNPRGRNPAIGVLPAPVLESDISPGLPVGEDDMMSGPQTDSELKLRLMRQRQKLILWAYDRQTGDAIRWLESPRPGFTVDLANGPKPLSCDVVSAAGEPTSVAVHYQIQTETSACPSGADKMILSHRWQMSHGHDRDMYLTRTIDGTIVFNGAVLRLLGIQPDTLRNQLIHPIPLGMQRTTPDVKLSSDGLTLKYRVMDTDPTICFDPANSGITRAEILEKLTYMNPTVDFGRPGGDVSNRTGL